MRARAYACALYGRAARKQQRCTGRVALRKRGAHDFSAAPLLCARGRGAAPAPARGPPKGNGGQGRPARAEGRGLGRATWGEAMRALPGGRGPIVRVPAGRLARSWGISGTASATDTGRPEGRPAWLHRQPRPLALPGGRATGRARARRGQRAARWAGRRARARAAEMAPMRANARAGGGHRARARTAPLAYNARMRACLPHANAGGRRARAARARTRASGSSN